MMHQPQRQKLTADLWAKAGELEKQFASYKKKVEKSDQVKDESTSREKKDGARGELYERYMKIRDVKLREGLNFRMERNGLEMATMWEQLEKSRSEMAARFGGAGVVAPVQTPSLSVSKKTVQLRRDLSDEKKGRDATPRSTNANTKRLGTLSQTSTSSQPSTTRCSTVSQSPKRSNTNATNRMKSLLRLNSPARSAAIFSDHKESRTPTTPRTRALTKSQSLVLEKNNAKGSKKKPPQTVNLTLRINETSVPLESKENDLIALEETPPTDSDMFFEPIVTIEDDILPKLQENLTDMMTNKETEEEIPSARSSLSQEFFDRIEHEYNNNSNDDMKIFEPDTANETFTTVNNVDSILNPLTDKEGESSGESSRSWCSNFETSFSRATIDPMIDSPIVSPRGGGSTSFRFLPEPTTVRVRKKWESRSISSPKGIKSFLSFGKKNKATGVLIGDMIAPPSCLNSSCIDDEIDSALNVLNLMSLASYEPNGTRNEIESDITDPLSAYQQAHALAGSLASSGAKYDRKDDRVSLNSQKAHRSFFAFPPFFFQRN